MNPPTSAESSSSNIDPEIFAGETTFASLGLRASVLKGVEALGFEKPTKIQATLIPVALTGRDVLGQAKTGTGKTAAFALPILSLADKDTPSQALVLAPTRELAIQIGHEINDLAKFTPLRALPVFGGQRMQQQITGLKKGAQIIVGTPGRVLDMVERGHLRFDNIRFVVLDEVDRMLDIGFREDIRRILKSCPAERQTILVSATISPEIEKLARSYMRNPEKLVVAAGSLTVSLVQQFYLPVEHWDKKRLLLHLLTHEEPALTLVFCRLKRSVDNVAKYLCDKGIDAHAIHADLAQGKRNQIMEKLRSGKLEVLIASDLASRGIDVEGITHVVNYDLPEDIELYVHRIGRTARAGRGGVAWSFVTPDQGRLLTQIEQLINAEVHKLDYPDFKPGPVPDDVRHQRERDAARANRPGANRFSASPPPAPGAHPPGTSAAPAASPAATTPALDPSKFPGGLVPTQLPTRRLQGRVRSSRR